MNKEEHYSKLYGLCCEGHRLGFCDKNCCPNLCNDCWKKIVDTIEKQTAKAIFDRIRKRLKEAFQSSPKMEYRIMEILEPEEKKWCEE